MHKKDALSKEFEVLNNWKVRIGIIMALLTPAIVGTAAVYDFKEKLHQEITNSRIEMNKTFVTKESMDSLREDVKDVKEDVRDIKNYLIRRPGK